MILSLFLVLISFFVYLDHLLFFWFLPLFLFLFYFCGLGFFDGVFCFDFFSFVLIFVTVLIFFFSLSSISLRFVGFLMIWFIFIFVFFRFFTIEYLFFYISFEFVFLLIFSFLLRWGLRFERLQASYYIFFYTIFFSLPFLVILVEYSIFYSRVFFCFNFFYYKDFFWVFIFFVFIVKLPLLGFHLWLPKAHVEAPVLGSIILAGVLLKLGGYGIFRFFFLFSFLNYYNSFFLRFIFYLSLLSFVITRFLCCRQIDLKIIIAYSSIVHISLILLGFLRFRGWGVYGSFLIIVAHGFISSLIFYLITLIYEVFHSRRLMILKGIIILYPVFCLFWLISRFLNLGFPPFISFYSEICIIGSLGIFSFLDFFFLILAIFFSGVYCVYLFIIVSHGVSYYYKILFISIKNLILSFGHLYFVIIYFLVFFYWSFSFKNISLWY